MWLCPSTTPGSVSTSRSRRVSFCFCAKLRTCACANLMSSRSRLATCEIARSTSEAVSLNEGGDQLSNCCDSSRTAASPPVSTEDLLDRRTHLGIGGLDRARVHSALEIAGHGTPPFCRRRPEVAAAGGPRRMTGIPPGPSPFEAPPVQEAGVAPQGDGETVKLSLAYLIACGLLGDPVPPVMIRGGPQKKNS